MRFYTLLFLLLISFLPAIYSQEWSGGYLCNNYFGYWDQYIHLNSDSTFQIHIRTDMGRIYIYPKKSEGLGRFRIENDEIVFDYKNRDIKIRGIKIIDESSILTLNKRGRALNQFTKVYEFDNNTNRINKWIGFNYYVDGLNIENLSVGYDKDGIIQQITVFDQNWNPVKDFVIHEDLYNYTEIRHILEYLKSNTEVNVDPYLQRSCLIKILYKLTTG